MLPTQQEDEGVEDENVERRLARQRMRIMENIGMFDKEEITDGISAEVPLKNQIPSIDSIISLEDIKASEVAQREMDIDNKKKSAIKNEATEVLGTITGGLSARERSQLSRNARKKAMFRYETSQCSPSYDPSINETTLFW